MLSYYVHFPMYVRYTKYSEYCSQELIAGDVIT